MAKNGNGLALDAIHENILDNRTNALVEQKLCGIHEDPVKHTRKLKVSIMSSAVNLVWSLREVSLDSKCEVMSIANEKGSNDWT